MEKTKKVLLVIFLLILVYGGYKLLIVDHDINYKINKYKIHEHFYINKNHFYDITITNNKTNYTYTLNKKLSKQKRIIKNIKTYKSNNLVCIIPIYKKDIELDIYCNLDNEQISNDYLIKTKNSNFNKILKKIKKYNINTPSNFNTKKKYKNILVYQKNILKDYNIYIWNYKGILILNNNNLTYKKVLNHDLYYDIMATSFDRYYVIFENTNVNGIENIYYYDSKKNKLNTFKLNKKLSKDSYINGVVDNKIYVTDRREKKEYKIDIRKNKIEQVDDNLKYIVYENNEKKKISKSDFFMNDQYFDNVYLKDNKITDSIELIKEGNYYYYLKDNRIYRVLDSNKKHHTLLLELDDIKEWKVYNNLIIIIAKDSIYTYTDKEGLRKIVKSNELKYNYKNIYKIGKK
ncbi:MAG: hypothetical protein IJ097_00165 [Bacilli bacterium]|nr:hypothetical protein [Bacilli bacterium]